MLVLDQVIDDAKELSRQLGATIRHGGAVYLQIGAEHRTTTRPFKTNPGGSAWKPRAKNWDPECTGRRHARTRFSEHVRLMLDMIALAFPNRHDANFVRFMSASRQWS